jgi:uncharacterized cupin superfamily protein
MNTEKKFSFTSFGVPGSFRRTELREKLGLTGCEVSINTLPATKEIPFVHAHKKNEEVYLILSGKGMIFLDGVVHKLTAGDAVRIAPDVQRCLKADDQEALTYICIQAREGATPEVTLKDGFIIETKTVWN